MSSTLLELQTFQICANMYVSQSRCQLHGLSITDARHSLLVLRVWAISAVVSGANVVHSWKQGQAVKGEVQSRIIIILKERVKISLQIGAKNDENRIRNNEVVTFWNFTFFRKTFLDQSLWIFKWVSWWCHHLTIFYTFHLQKWKKSHFSAMRM